MTKSPISGYDLMLGLDDMPTLRGGTVWMHGALIGRMKRWVGETCYVTHRTSRHYFVKYHGFGLSTAVIAGIKQRYVDFAVIIIYHGAEGVRVLRSHINDWALRGHPYLDDTWGIEERQLILTEGEMERLA